MVYSNIDAESHWINTLDYSLLQDPFTLTFLSKSYESVF